MEIVTPEDLLGQKRPKILSHHGTCDCCKKRNIPITHFGYDTQPDRDYRICEKCLDEFYHFKTTRIPRCTECKTNFIPAYDPISKKVSKHTWKPNCKCYKKPIRISIG